MPDKKSNSPPKSMSPIGDQTRQIVNTLRSKAETQTGSGKTSSTGARTPAQRSGSRSSPGSSGSDGAGLPATGVRQDCRTPVEVSDDEAMSLITLCAGSRPEAIWTDQYDRDGVWDGRPARYEMEVCVNPGEVAKIVDTLTRPAERQEVAGRFRQLAELPGQGDAGGARYWAESVWEAVQEFPSDVIIQACKDINKREKWRPVPSAVREQCLWVGRKREALRQMVRRLNDEPRY